MPESVVQVTEGSGKLLHTFQRTIGANTVEDEVVLLGENYLASYIASGSTSPTTATAASHLLQIMAGATLKVRIRRIEVWQSQAATAVTLATFGLLRLTTAGTGGTAATPSALDPSDGASGATAMYLPTVKGTEGAIIGFPTAVMYQTLATGVAPTTLVSLWDFDRPRSKPLIIAAGAANGICIKNVAAIAGGLVNIVVWFDESNF